jgi:predicted nuclease of predicted toxin-antitoxin system
LARAYGRVLLTLDRDFGRLAVLLGEPHSGIVRMVDVRLSEQADRCSWVLQAYEQALGSGAIITIEPSRVRVRPEGG